MFNIAVLRLKDIVKYFVGVILLILIMIIATTYFSNFKNKSKEIKGNVEKKAETVFSSISQNSLLSCLDKTMPVVSSLNEEYKNIAKEDDVNSDKNILQEVLKTQISSIKGLEETEKKVEESTNKENAEQVNANNESQDTNENNDQSQEIQQDNSQLAQVGLPTEVITQNPITESFNVQYGNVKIKNQTQYTLTQEMLNPDITIENKNFVLFHTHSCESYTASEKYPYTPTGTFRTTDLNFTVTRVGTELENQLKLYNYNVIHDTSYHDYPAYNGSYTRSLKTVENILQTNPSDIIIDLHRDAIGSRSDYAPIVKIGEEVAAQLMFVVGTNAGGLWHPNWNQNLKFAIKIQEKAEELYPGLFKPIMLTESRYNQHTGKYASIIEVGATGNTLEQCLTSMKYLAKVISEVVK